MEIFWVEMMLGGLFGDPLPISEADIHFVTKGKEKTSFEENGNLPSNKP